MGIEDQRSISFSSAGFGDTIGISELASVITGEGLEQSIESGAAKPFQTVRSAANAFCCLVRHEYNMLKTRHALREHE